MGRDPKYKAGVSEMTFPVYIHIKTQFVGHNLFVVVFAAPLARVVTTVSDVLVTVVMFAMAWFYQRAVTSKRGTANDLGFSRPLLELPGEGCSSANSDRHLCCLLIVLWYDLFFWGGGGL